MVLRVLRQPRYVVLILVGVALAVGCVLAGRWQLDRYHTKHDANTELAGNDALGPVPVGDVMTAGQPASPDLRFRRVTATGRYDPGGQVLVRGRQVSGQPAFLILTPLRTTDGPNLFVVRGWTPVEGAATATPVVPDPVGGEVTITARVFPSESASGSSDLPAGQIDRIDVPGLAGDRPAFGGYAELVSQDPADDRVRVIPPPDLGNPAGGASEAQHAGYVAQWWFFAALALVAPFALARLETRRTGSDREPVPPERADAAATERASPGR